MITRCHLDSGHLRYAESNGLTLSRHKHDLIPQLNPHFESQQPRNHKLSTIRNGVNGRVLDHTAFIRRQERLQRADHPPQIRLVTLVIPQPLRIQYVMQGDHALTLIHRSASHTPQLLHVCAHAEQQTQMHAQRPNVRTCLARDPEHAQMPVIVELVQFAFVDSADAQLALDGRDERRALEQSAREGFQGARELRLSARQGVVEADYAHIFLAGALLGLHETGSAIDAHYETAGDFRIEGSAMASFLDPGRALLERARWWGLLSYRNIRLIHDTTSWLDGFEGLSRLITPELMYCWRGRFKGVHPAGMGVKCPVLTSTVTK